MSLSSVIAIGLPNAGKSTFIAALAYILQHQEIPTALQLHQLSEDTSYVNTLVADWLKCKPFQRTPSGLTNVRFALMDSTGPRGEIVFPDIAGETFEQHWALREWEPEYARVAKSAAGLLLFVHPGHLEKPFSIADQARVAAAAGIDVEEDVTDEGAPTPPGDTEAKMPEATQYWEPSKAASQVKLVDFLQMIETQTTKAKPLRLAVIVSAWDKILKINPTADPAAWLEASAPLLHQYLTMNPETFQFRVYGVSAQGGDNKDDALSLRAFSEPSKRVKVAGPNCAEHDITAPLIWVLSSDA
ncbi:MAG TPA: hypothetical protein VGH51_20050 [Candidatus Angelobacter sp.]|jgi:hypothetical protein